MTTYESCGATVERTHVPGGYGGSSEYVVTGPLEAVSAAIDRIKSSYPPGGYGTWFNWPPPPDGPKRWDGKPSPYKMPVLLRPGVWRAKGHHGNSCE